MIAREVIFYDARNAPFGRMDLLLLIDYELQSDLSVESGDYDPKTKTYHHTDGEPVRGTVRAWAAAPVITLQEIES